jgi:multimeric flavodoxin WrbA
VESKERGGLTVNLIAINGSPRKNWNTATLLGHCMRGAESKGAKTQLFHLYELTYKGCQSCFLCKMTNGVHYGRCATFDELSPLLQAIREQADMLILGSPIYFGAVTGEMKSFLERLLFASHLYASTEGTVFPRKLKTAFIYTMNIPETMIGYTAYGSMIKAQEANLLRTFGHTETYCCYDTYQFGDYAKVEAEMFDPVHKAERREKVFPVDCQSAFELGCRLAETP